MPAEADPENRGDAADPDLQLGLIELEEPITDDGQQSADDERDRDRAPERLPDRFVVSRVIGRLGLDRVTLRTYCYSASGPSRKRSSRSMYQSGNPYSRAGSTMRAM